MMHTGTKNFSRDISPTTNEKLPFVATIIRRETGDEVMKIYAATYNAVAQNSLSACNMFEAFIDMSSKEAEAELKQMFIDL